MAIGSLINLSRTAPLFVWRAKAGGRASFSGVRNMATAEAVIIHVTAPDKQVASAIASRLVEQKLAACVQTLPGIESTYTWEGKVETSQELLLLVKTRKSLTEKVVELVNSVHPYDTAEVIATPIEGGSERYLKWLSDSTQPT